jgi:hypothetical protein
MPVQGYAVTMLWADGVHSISETYFWNAPGDDALEIVYPASNMLMKLRTAMMGITVVPIRFRISLLGKFRYYITSKPKDISEMKTGPYLLTASLSQAQKDAGISPAMDGSPDQANVCILLDSYATPQSHARRFLAGVPDVLSRENPSGPWIVGIPSWGNALDAYRNLLKAADTKWAFRARTLPDAAPWAPIKVTGFAQDPQTSLFSVTVPTFIAPVVKGAMMQLRGFKMKKSVYKSPNGTWQIGDLVPSGTDGESIYTLRGTEGVAGTQVLLAGTAQGVDFSLYRYKVSELGKETTHKRGNRALASPGKRKTVQRVSA